jgi:hypothetical protein
MRRLRVHKSEREERSRRTCRTEVLVLTMDPRDVDVVRAKDLVRPGA